MIYWEMIKVFVKAHPKLVRGVLIALVILACGVSFMVWVGNVKQEAYNSGVASQIAKQDEMINEAMKSAMASQEKVRKQYEKIYMEINAADDNSGACVLVDRVIDGLPDSQGSRQ
jgi:Tfp pilus assembly protein PilV